LRLWSSKRSGAAFLRFWDGDYQLSELEIQGFYVNRGQPRFDVAAVAGTSTSDLDPDLVARYLVSIRDGDQRFRRYRDDNTVLVKVAYSQLRAKSPPQAYSRLATYRSNGFQTSSSKLLRDRLKTTAPTSVSATEPDSQDRFQSCSTTRSTGFGATADARLVLTNPGGLFGVSVDRLGQQALSSARNLTLLRIRQFVGMADGNAVEALATGIPKIIGATAAAGVLPPLFFDQALSFTAVLRRSDRNANATDRRTANQPSVTPARQRVLDALQSQPLEANELAAKLHVSPDFVRKSLRILIDQGLVIRDGGPGQRFTRYRVS
jgi:ATP-dependent DNA helicase RecG